MLTQSQALSEPVFALPAQAAFWFFVASLPICFWVILSDLRAMRIPNKAVLALVAVFLLVGVFVLPLPVLGMQLVNLVVILLAGIVLNAAGAFGAGDAKFAAAAAPFVMLADVSFMMMLLAVTLLAGFLTHRLAGRTPLRRLAPDWESWERRKDFPMGLSLGSSLAIYLGLAALYGS
ncbi:MAG: prepilin peptidase [Rhodobacterales bacterium]|nr:prepilin peptidase [Rhodobacterales bacterium]MDX5389945.1 prepilin peptidase [Rhodobacterales bacterium]MDX5489636.1 prepilin peptidase [Rhodobacterales bacterium]